MSVFQDISYNKSFSQLARESKFTFNLYRGRVDWRKLEVLDVDRIVRDQDVELLNVHINSVTNCNLESEYDVKILDPNFIKLFRLAQLLIDFLLHCKQYLEHCIKVAYENLQASNKEVELLRRQVQARKSEVKQLKKKVKDVKQQLFHSPRVSNPTFECSLCGKFFMGEKYLDSHHSRRHAFTPYSIVLKPPSQTTEPHKVNIVMEEFKNVQKMENTTNMKKKYQEEIEELKSMFFAEIEKLKQNEESKKQIEKANNVLNDSNVVSGSNMKTLPLSDKENNEQASVNTEVVKVGAGEGIEEWRQRLEERESVWRARLSALDQQHKKQVQHLQERLDSSQLQGQEMKKELEQRLEEVLSKFEQSQALLESKNHIINAGRVQECNTSHETSIAKHQEEYLQNINLDYIDNTSKLKHPPPVQKRKAFVSQKSKTIQDLDSAESFQVKEHRVDSVKILRTGDESDNESSSASIKPTAKENKDHTSGSQDTREPYEQKIPSFIQSKSIISEQMSRSKNKENIITKLLEEEKLNIINKNHTVGSNLINDDESSISETTTDTESETEISEEKQSQIKTAVDKRQTETKQIILQQINPKPSEKQLVRTDPEVVQQSLQSMEALLSANPTILQQLRGDLEDLVGKRLRGLGVDPAWTSLPPITFRNKMAVLTHQRGITAKNHKVYFTLRDKLNQDAEAAACNRPTQSTTDSVLARLRKKAAVIVNAATFTRHLDRMKQTSGLIKSDSSNSNPPQPLASSSPHRSPHQSITLLAQKEDISSYKIPKIQSEDSLSLSSSTSGDTRQLGISNVTYSRQSRSNLDSGSYKSALRNAVSTGNLAKKKVLFVDEAIKNDKRSRSENTVGTSDSFATHLDNVSVSNLVQEIQLQLSQRSGKPAHSVDLTQPAELPLSQILPLSRSGRELLESQSSLTVRTSSTNISAAESKSVSLSDMLQKVSVTKPTLSSEKMSPRSLEVLNPSSNQKVPFVKSSPLPSLVKKNDPSELPSDFKKPPSKNLLQPPTFSPTQSLSSIGSSLDISFSPRDRKGSLELDLQDLEDNFKY